MDNRERSKWSNPVMWLIVGLPLASVVFGVGLVVIASRDSGDVAIDPVRRTAQMQVADLGPDALAQRKKLSAVLRIAGDAIEVIPVDGEFDRASPLRLSLLHPTQSDADRVLTLAPAETGWRIEQAVDPGNDWNLRLEPIDGRWRIGGRLPKGQQAAHLAPALKDAG
ncbi:MAG TPA: FixH family protein [Lysobacter sp.]|nr:FixH family protein [Lysobacter sp.]